MAILVWLIVAETLYVRALRVLSRRGVTVPRGQIVLWHLGLGLQAVALLSPLGTNSDELLSAHMASTSCWPTSGPAAARRAAQPGAGLLPAPRDPGPLARNRRLRTAFRTLRKPLVASRSTRSCSTGGT